MWTANDFLANEMLSRWSAHGKLVFLYYIKNNKAFTLMNDEKHLFLLSQTILANRSQLKLEKKNFFIGGVERDITPPLPSSEELHHMVLEYHYIMYGFQSGKQKLLGFGLTYNRIKQNIFFELPYSKPNLLYHNLDVMDIERNMFENISNTVMDVKGKTKDNIKATMNITLFYHYEIWSWFMIWSSL